ncbi:TPA: hypothetical protein HA241_02515 [Candidatus Woesearchaeota archaeon]|nr:hypothetical protein [Candidatus Woesearchaeota archaeon]
MDARDLFYFYLLEIVKPGVGSSLLQRYASLARQEVLEEIILVQTILDNRDSNYPFATRDWNARVLLYGLESRFVERDPTVTSRTVRDVIRVRQGDEPQQSNPPIFLYYGYLHRNIKPTFDELAFIQERCQRRWQSLR